MKHTTKCSKCDKQFTHDSKNKADQALRMHIGRSHSNKITPGNTAPVAKRAYNKKAKKLEVSVNYCPTCGCNLHAVAMGIAMATK